MPMLGVCTECQETHPVRPAHVACDEMKELIEDEGEVMAYVMSRHGPSFGGGYCEGEGTPPQAIFPEK